MASKTPMAPPNMVNRIRTAAQPDLSNPMIRTTRTVSQPMVNPTANLVMEHLRPMGHSSPMEASPMGQARSMVVAWVNRSPWMSP